MTGYKLDKNQGRGSYDFSRVRRTFYSRLESKPVSYQKNLYDPMLYPLITADVPKYDLTSLL